MKIETNTAILNLLATLEFWIEDPDFNGLGTFDFSPKCEGWTRVILTDSEVTIFKFTASQCLLWKCEFSESTPVDIILSAIESATAI